MMQQQRGFTLIEMLVVTAIVGAIVVVVGMTVTTLLINSKQSIDQQTLLQQLKSTSYWIQRDVNMAGDVILSSPNGFPFTINIPVDQDENHNYDVEYLFDGDKMVRRQYNYLGSLTAETTVAQYVDVNNTTCDNVTESSYKLTIRVSMGEEAVTASYEARRRLAAETGSE